MRHIILPGLAAATALALVTVAPASAAPGDVTTTTTTHTVQAASFAEVDGDTTKLVFQLQDDGSAFDGPFAPAGPVAFPLVATIAAANDDDDVDAFTVAEGLFSPPAAPESCTRTVSSFSFSYELSEVNTWHFDAVNLYSAILSGTAGDVAPLTEETVDADSPSGVELLDIDGVPSVAMEWVSTPYSEEPLSSGSTTLTYPEPVAAANAAGYIALSASRVSSWTITDASFVVTDICTSVEGPAVIPPVVVPPVVEPPVVEPPVVVPPVVEPPVVVPPVVEPPVVVPPAVEPPVVVPPVVVPPAVVPPVAVPPVVSVPAATPAQPLAETGVDAGFVGAAAALLMAAGAAGLLFARRRATR